MTGTLLCCAGQEGEVGGLWWWDAPCAALSGGTGRRPGAVEAHGRAHNREADSKLMLMDVSFPYPDTAEAHTNIKCLHLKFPNQAAIQAPEYNHQTSPSPWLFSANTCWRAGMSPVQACVALLTITKAIKDFLSAPQLKQK